MKEFFYPSLCLKSPVRSSPPALYNSDPVPDKSSLQPLLNELNLMATALSVFAPMLSFRRLLLTDVEQAYDSKGVLLIPHLIRDGDQLSYLCHKYLRPGG